MASLIGGIGASQSPTIGFAKDTKRQDDPAWAPIFDGFAEIRRWVREKRIEVIVMIYNDHVTSFFFDHYSAFCLGIDDRYVAADEGGGPRAVPPVRGHAAFARHIGAALMADEFDMSFFQNKPLDHGCLSPLGMLGDESGDWAGAIPAGPDKLLDALAANLGHEHGAVRLHFYPFGGIAKTVDWIATYAAA